MLNLIGDISAVASKILYVILALVVLMFMILIHELGHYTAGKILKFKINEFSVGMGPKLLSKKKKNGEVISLRLLPLGGFCAFEGEDTDDGAVNPASFNNQKPWKRLIVLFSGAFFNFISALIIAVVVFSCFGDASVTVRNVYDYAPEFNRASLQPDDVIYEINGKKVYIAGDFSYQLARAGDTFDVTVIRHGELVPIKGLKKDTFNIPYVKGIPVPVTEGETKLTVGDSVYKIDGKTVSSKSQLDSALAEAGDIFSLTVISAADGKEFTFNTVDKSAFEKIALEMQKYTGVGMATGYTLVKYGFGESLGRSFPYCFEVAGLVLRTIGGLFTGSVGINEIGGPISTISLTSEVVAAGFGNVLSLIVMISVNLAVFNLLPVPALDGCKMIFVLIEWIAGRPVNRKVEAYINGIGFILLLVFVILIDVLKL